MARTSAMKKPSPAAISGTRYFALDAKGNVMPVGNHKAVRIENDLLARPLIVSAYHCGDEAVSFKRAAKVAEKHDAYGWDWRLPTIEEAFFIPDRSKYPALPKEFFPDYDGGWEWIWTSTVDASAPSDYAWLVGLRDGYAYRYGQTGRYRVRAVRAGQF